MLIEPIRGRAMPPAFQNGPPRRASPDDRPADRFWRTREVRLRGYDPTGMSVYENCVGACPDAVIENYRIVAREQKVVFDPEVIRSLHDPIEEIGSLFLPLSDDGQTVNMVLVYTHHRSI